MKRQEQRKKEEAIKLLEREIKSKEQDERDQKVQRIKDRRLKKLEAERLEAFNLKLNQKKSIRLKNRLMRKSKK